MQNKKGNPGMVIVPTIYTDKDNNIKNLPPQNKAEEELTVVFMSPILLAAMEKKGEVMKIAKAYEGKELPNRDDGAR